MTDRSLASTFSILSSAMIPNGSAADRCLSLRTTSYPRSATGNIGARCLSGSGTTAVSRPLSCAAGDSRNDLRADEAPRGVESSLVASLWVAQRANYVGRRSNAQELAQVQPLLSFATKGIGRLLEGDAWFLSIGI